MKLSDLYLHGKHFEVQHWMLVLLSAQLCDVLWTGLWTSRNGWVPVTPYLWQQAAADLAHRVQRWPWARMKSCEIKVFWSLCDNWTLSEWLGMAPCTCPAHRKQSLTEHPQRATLCLLLNPPKKPASVSRGWHMLGRLLLDPADCKWNHHLSPHLIDSYVIASYLHTSTGDSCDKMLKPLRGSSS